MSQGQRGGWIDRLVTAAQKSIDEGPQWLRKAASAEADRTTK